MVRIHPGPPIVANKEGDDIALFAYINRSHINAQFLRSAALHGAALRARGVSGGRVAAHRNALRSTGRAQPGERSRTRAIPARLERTGRRAQRGRESPLRGDDVPDGRRGCGCGVPLLRDRDRAAPQAARERTGATFPGGAGAQGAAGRPLCRVRPRGHDARGAVPPRQRAAGDAGKPAVPGVSDAGRRHDRAVRRAGENAHPALSGPGRNPS